MRHRFKISALAVTGLLVLSGCGGGGGGQTGVSNLVTMSGTVAKGILMGADVLAYEVVAGQQAAVPLASTKTNLDGEYELKLPPNTGPVIVVVKANAATKMLDETQTLADGRFAEVAAPTNLVMRSFAMDVRQTVSVRVNPYTEMAVAVAGNTGNLSLNSLIAGQQVANLATPNGVNPFSQIPAAKASDMDEGQLKFAVQMAGLLRAAKTNAACDLVCQMADLSKNVKLTLESDGKAKLPGDTLLAIQQKKEAVLTSGSAAFEAVPNQQSRLAQVKAALQEEVKADVAQARDQAQKSESSQTTSPAEVVAANGLDGFVKAMRDGFRTTETRLLKAEEDLNKRYENVTLEGVSFANRVLDAIGDDCDADVLVCRTNPWSSFRWTGSNGNYAWTNTAPDALGRTSSGTVVGVKGADGKTSVLVNGSISKAGKPLLVMRDIALSLIDAGGDNYFATIKGTVQANDSQSNLTVVLNFEDIQVQSLVVKSKEVSNVAIKGGLSLAASNGDRLTGSLDIKMVEVRRRVFFGDSNQWWYDDYEEYVTDGSVQFQANTTASGAPMEILALDVKLTSSQPDYTRPVSVSNVQTYNATVKVALADQLTKVTFNEFATGWQTVNQTATIASGGSEVRLSVIYSLANTRGPWCQWNNNVMRCADELRLTSTNANPYTATLTKGTNGKSKGDIFLGSTKVGEIVNGVLKINGAEVSLY
jgi:hypothetical protein